MCDHQWVATVEDAAALLGRVPMFTGLSDGELSELAQVAVPRSYLAGEVIFREGDSGDTCFVVRSGSARVVRGHSDGRTVTLAELRPGDVFGELAMFDDETRSATVEALEEMSALALLSGDMRRLLRRHPDIAVKMLAALADRLRAANERITRQSFQTVSGRVAAALLGQVEARQAEGATPTDVLVQATQADIAQLAGSSRESASRFLATLERAGLVTCGRGRVVVHDPAALKRYIY